MTAVSLIVMERGSEWPGHVGDAADIVAVGHDEDGLLQRTRQGIASVLRRGQHVRVAVLACNEAIDSASRVRRAEVVAELLSALNAGRFGHLVLSATERAPIHLRGELLSLAGALSRPAPSATVSVRFGARAGHRRALPGTKLIR